MQRYFAKSKENEGFILYDTDIHHIKNVMRCKTNDEIEVVYDKKVHICKIINLEPLTLKVLKQIKENNELDIKLTIAISLVNEQKFDLILQKLTELGVRTIIPIKTERSIVKLDDKKINKKLERWQKICKEASEQSHRNIVPEVKNIISIKELININKELKLICSLNDNTKPLSIYLKEKPKDILVAIGPEGGFTKQEEELLINNKYMPTTLGKRVMRVETAAIYVTSIINYICEG